MGTIRARINIVPVTDTMRIGLMSRLSKGGEMESNYCDCRHHKIDHDEKGCTVTLCPCRAFAPRLMKTIWKAQ